MVFHRLELYQAQSEFDTLGKEIKKPPGTAAEAFIALICYGQVKVSCGARVSNMVGL